MASLVFLSSSNQRAIELEEGKEMIKEGLSVFQKHDGTRAQAISTGASVMASVFGVADDAQAQAFNDRWASVLSAIFNSADPDYAAYGKLRDLLDATIQQ